MALVLLGTVVLGFTRTLYLILLLYLLPFLWWDRRQLGRIHTVTAWSSVALVGCAVLRMPRGRPTAWQTLASTLLGS